jgi:PAS domain S-box-containing protein
VRPPPTPPPAAAAPNLVRAIRPSGALTAGLLTGFGAIVLVLLGTLVVGLVNLRRVADAGDAVAHTNAVETGLERLLATLVDAETGERGFIITGNPSYLEPYDRARSEIQSRITAVRALTADDRDHQADLDQLSAAADAKLRELADTVQQRRELGFAAAQAAVASHLGKRIMDDVRVIVARMEAREGALLAVRRTQAAESYRYARNIRIATTGLALVVVIGLFVVTRRLGAERVRAAESAERLRVTLASIGDAVIATDDEGRVIRVNGVAEALTGWTQADALGRRLEDIFVIINEQTRQPVESPVGKVLRDGLIAGLANHTVLVSKNGREIPIDDSAAPIRSAEGEMTGVVLVFRDITERRRVEREHAALLENERTAHATAESAIEQLGVALEAGRMGTWEFAPRAGTVKWSPGLEAIHGLSPGTFPGTFEAFQNEIYPADRAMVLEAISQAIEQGRDHHIEYRIVRPDGKVRWVEGRGRLLKDADGRPVRMMGVCTDITERRQAEEKFRLVVQAAPAAMIMVDRRGTIQLVNELTEQLLGYTRDELLGQSVDRLVPARFGEAHPGFRAAFFADSRQRPMGEGRDLYALRKDGTEVAVEIGLSPVETADGPFVLAAISDITERKRIAALLQHALEAERAATRKAEHANELKDQFLATVSHELRAPLNAVLGWAEMLRENVLEGARRQRALDAVYNNAKRQSQLIDDLLDVARFVSGHMRVERTAVNLQAVIRGALDVVEPSAQAQRIAVAVDLEESIGLILGDAARLQQVVWNLLTNAVKFTPEGGAIHVRARRTGEFIEIAVADTGQGIDSEFLPWVFEPFRQADTSTTRVHGGLGLGLAIVKHLVEAHDGTVRCESAGKGQGATFTVRLPIVAVFSGNAGSDDTPRPMSSRTAMAAPTATALSGTTVLVVDDDAESRELLTVTLETYGAHVVTAASAAEAVHALGTHSINVLLSDIGMPEEDGYSLIRAIRAQEVSSQSHLPAAALTSFTGEDDRQHALRAGFETHLAKPIDAHSLVEAVATLARGVRMP